MHLLVPYASDQSEACRHVLRDLSLPNLGRWLSRLGPAARDDGEATSRSPPHERALAAARGWHGSDGAYPFAAEAARGDGIDVGDEAWGLLTPAHWQLGHDGATLLDPALLELGDAESRALFESVAELFRSEGFTVAWGAATRWYVGHAMLADFPTASLDRVIGRNVDRWLGETRSPAGRLIRRLQSEAQLVWHSHPVNEAREARGRTPVNSFWLSGCGVAQAIDSAREPQVDASLRSPLLAADWAAWAEAWRALDAGPIARSSGSGGALTLCGERSAARFAPGPGGWLRGIGRHWRGVDPQPVLEGL